MEDYKLIDVAYGALLHDIGKFYQRTYENQIYPKENLKLPDIIKMVIIIVIYIVDTLHAF